MNWRSLPMKGLYATGIVVASFFISLWTMDYFSQPCSTGRETALKGPFRKFSGGFAFVAAAPTLESLSDSAATPTRSKVVVCENNQVLGPPHTVHAEIDAKGLGRFSHWSGAGFVFSATDNSDPNTNGRYYQAIEPR